MKTDNRSTSRLRHDPLVRGLGWASALLGMPQVAAPAGFARALGVDGTLSEWPGGITSPGRVPRRRCAVPCAVAG